MKCGTVICTNSTVMLVEWPGQPTMLCEPCVRRAQGVAEVMGFRLVLEPIPPAVGRFDGADRLPLSLAMGLSALPYGWCSLVVEDIDVGWCVRSPAIGIAVQWCRFKTPQMVSDHLKALGFNELGSGRFAREVAL